MALIYLFTQRIPRILKLLAIISLFLLLFGIAIHLIEPATFPHFLDGIWWAIVTISTIGYGDYAPESLIGRIIATILILSGVGLFTTYFATVAKVAISSEEHFLNGTKEFSGSDHIIIVGWNERSKGIIKEIHDRKHEQAIVLIDHTLRKHPLPRTNIHFIHGKANVDEILLRANVQTASFVLITADLQQNEFQTDMFSILTLLAIKGLNPTVYCLVEILTEEQKENAKRAGADSLVETNRFASEYMFHFVFYGQAKPFANQTIVTLKELPLEPQWLNLSFKKLSTILLEQNLVLVGFNRGDQRKLSPPIDTVLQENDILLIVSPN